MRSPAARSLAMPRRCATRPGRSSRATRHFDRSDLQNAKAQLQWVLESSPHEDFRDLARLRLAAVLLDEKQHDEALKLLDAPRGAAYEAHYAALRGDLLVAKKQVAEARAAYQVALEKSDRRDGAFRDSVRMRLEALGG
ncbi:MAG: hypothetical protein K0S03_1948 [Burkholderiales bacterium]|nr:hypothetical protein [Burkholderiales bacterium]